MSRLLIGLLVAGLLIASASYASVAMQRREALEYREDRPIVYLPPPLLAEVMSLGHRTLFADTFWIQALQYSTAHNFRHQYRDLPRFIELAVHLDPDFEYAYWWGGTTSPHNTGRWNWVNVEASTRILEKGLERFPDNWRMWLQLGFNKGIIGTDRQGATKAFANAARSPGAPFWIGQLAARYAASTGEFDAARMYTQAILADTDEQRLRDMLERRLLEIDIEETLVFLDGAVHGFIREHGTPPTSLQELIDSGIIDELPEDPLGGRYYIEHAEVRSTSLLRGRLRPFDRPTGEEQQQQVPEK